MSAVASYAPSIVESPPTSNFLEVMVVPGGGHSTPLSLLLTQPYCTHTSYLWAAALEYLITVRIESYQCAYDWLCPSFVLELKVGVEMWEHLAPACARFRMTTDSMALAKPYVAITRAVILRTYW